MNHQLYLPVETLEHIIWLISDSNDARERWKCEHKSTFLSCALVCKTWASIARRRLVSLYFPEGRVKITSEPNNVLDLIVVFQSPLRTLDPTFIRILCCTSSRNPSREMDISQELFFMVLSILDASLFPSLREIEFDGPLFSTGSGRNFTASSGSVLSQIKSIIISPLEKPSFKNLIHTIRLCPFVEEITLQSGDTKKIPPWLYQEFPPPTSLRKIILDVPSLREMAKWLMRCQPPHTTISSLTICDFSWNDEYHGIQKFLDQIGPNLEELVLDMCDWEEDGDFSAGNPDERPARFTKNVQVRRLTLRGPPDVIAEVAPYLLKQAQFAPALEVLNITFQECYDEEIPYLVKFKLLDEYAHTRSSLRQIIISSTEVKNWEEVKSCARKYMPRCEEKGILELGPCPKERIRF